MKKLSVYDHALCCSSGVCGTDVDQALVAFSANVAWLKQHDVVVERFNLSLKPMAFVQNLIAKSFLECSGAESLPLILLNGEFVMSGRYPSRQDLASWFQISLEKVDVAATTGCCGGKTSCC